MPTDLTLILHDQPGELARVGEVAGSSGIHILGMAAFTVPSTGDNDAVDGPAITGALADLAKSRGGKCVDREGKPLQPSAKPSAPPAVDRERNIFNR